MNTNQTAAAIVAAFIQQSAHTTVQPGPKSIIIIAHPAPYDTINDLFIAARPLLREFDILDHQNDAAVIALDRTGPQG